MKKELPGIYKSEMGSRVNRNRNVYHISSDESSSKKAFSSIKDGMTVEEKLKKLFQSSRYIFNIGVEIITGKKIYHTKIAGKVKNSIVTIDGEVIPIIEIEDIIIKDRL